MLFQHGTEVLRTRMAATYLTNVGKRDTGTYVEKKLLAEHWLTRSAPHKGWTSGGEKKYPGTSTPVPEVLEAGEGLALGRQNLPRLVQHVSIERLTVYLHAQPCLNRTRSNCLGHCMGQGRVFRPIHSLRRLISLEDHCRLPSDASCGSILFPLDHLFL